MTLGLRPRAPRQRDIIPLESRLFIDKSSPFHLQYDWKGLLFISPKYGDSKGALSLW